MANLIYFFAYDKMMNLQIMQDLGLEYKALFCVTLSSYKVVFNKIPLENEGQENLGLANIVPTEHNLGAMAGVLYEMDESFLPKLDEYYMHPQEYQRRVMRFTKHDFTLTNGFVYIAPIERTKKGLKPNKSMMKLLKGAKKNLQMLYFSRLMTTPTCD